MRAGNILWKTSHEEEGEGVLSMLLPRGLRRFLFHNYAEEVRHCVNFSRLFNFRK